MTGPGPALLSERDALVRVGAALAGVIVAFAILRYRLLDPVQGSWAEDIAWTLFSAGAAWRSFRAARSARGPRHRIGWRLLGGAASAWLAGMILLLWGAVRVPDFDPYPTPANWLFLSFAPLFAAGLFFLRSAPSESRLDGKRVADLGLIFSSVTMVSVIVLLDPLLDTGDSAEEILFSVLDPALFVTAALFAFALYWLDDLDELGTAGLLLVGAVVIHMSADLAYFRVVLVDQRPFGLSLAPTWLVAFGLQFLAAEAYDRGSDVVDERARADSQETRRSHHGFLEAALPAPLVAMLAFFGIVFRDQLSDRTMLALAPLLLLFAILLGFREWWVDRAEERAFRKLEASMDLTNQILAASPAAVFTLDPETPGRPIFLTRNPAPGFPLGEEGPEGWTVHIHPDDRSLVREHIERAAEGRARSFECRIGGEVGGYRWVDVRLAPYHSDDDRPRRLVGSIVDIDDTKRLEARLLRGQRMEALGRLSGGIAHDFNNLLTTILGHAQLGQVEEPISASTRENLEAVQEAAQRAQRLTGQLLAFSRRQGMRLEVIDLTLLVRSMTEMLSRTLGEDISIDLHAPRERLSVRADPSQMEQVILNLVVNARDAMPEGGELRIEVDEVLVDSSIAGGEDVPPGRYALLSVSDTGAGMTEMVQERIFEPFFTTKDAGRGTGLGLATLHGVVKQHSGYVEVTSRPGAGSTFRIHLPVADEEPASHDPPVESPHIQGGTETILIVDDEPSIPRLLTDALTPAGYDVLTATSPAEAIRLVESMEARIDLLLTDVVMPEMPGRALASRLKELDPDLRVVYMSGYPDDSDLLKEVTGGSIPFVSKPLVLSRLAALLRSVLDEKREGPEPA